MKLQINQRGAWRHVVEFDAARLEEVQQAAKMLAGVLPRTKWRITDGLDLDHLPKVIAFLIYSGNWQPLQ